jgi:hypothetical protein
MTGSFSDNEDIQREANKLLADYKFKLQKAEQDMSTLQATVARLESQVIRYKSAAEASEKAEDELKVEKRKLQREVCFYFYYSYKRFICMCIARMTHERYYIYKYIYIYIYIYFYF